MINRNEKGEIIPHKQSYMFPMHNNLRLGIEWEHLPHKDLGSVRRNLYQESIMNPLIDFTHTNIFTSTEMDLSRLRSNIVKYKMKDVTVTMIWLKYNSNNFKIQIETCLYSELDEFVTQYNGQFTDMYLHIAYSSETNQIIMINNAYTSINPNYPMHDNPKTAKKRMRKLNEGVEPEKISEQHRMNDPTCICETCQLIKEIHENYSR